MIKDPFPSLRKVNPVWHQQAWCHVGHPIIKTSKTVAVTPAMEPYINRLSLSVTSNEAARNWKESGKNNLCSLTNLPKALKSLLIALGISVVASSPLTWKSSNGYMSESRTRLGSFLMMSLTQAPGRQQTSIGGGSAQHIRPSVPFRRE